MAVAEGKGRAGQGRTEANPGTWEEEGVCEDPRRDPGFGTLEVSGHRGRASGEPREAGRDTHERSRDQRTETGVGRRGTRQKLEEAGTRRLGNLHTLQSTETPFSSEIPFCSLGCSEPSLMQAAWLLGALVVPQLLSFSHGARGAEREWEGVWGGAQEEEREREALMLKVSWGGLGL